LLQVFDLFLIRADLEKLVLPHHLSLLQMRNLATPNVRLLQL
jgi:hypothetical protein